LYKILIENAFNPQSRQAEEIEKYLETLLKAYENELDAIRKRARVNKIKELFLYHLYNSRVYNQEECIIIVLNGIYK
jgi:hypothetical protein